MQDQAFEDVVRYHEQTKHHFHRFARSLGYMDWKNQPNPFRQYEGENPIRLPLLNKEPPSSYTAMYGREDIGPQPFATENIAAFLELGLGLSAWKALSTNQWSLRINPSSGNLHPTESHLILPPMGTLQGGVFHYNPLEHSLERRAVVPLELWRDMRAHMKRDGFMVALTSIFWRESWKYGERAFRYCNHDMGHALACLSLSAGLQGWNLKILNGLSDDDIERVLGFPKVEWVDGEEEQPEALCFVYGNNGDDVTRSLPPHLVSALADLPFSGRPNILSQQRVPWEAISRVAVQTRKPATLERRHEFQRKAFFDEDVPSVGASAVIRRRRSAQAFSGRGSLTRNQFLAILDRTLPRQNCPPFDLELMEPAVHLLLFVHGVQGLQQGLYFLCRNDSHLEQIRSIANPAFVWERIHPDVPLFFLQPGDLRRMATRLSCDQDIAGDSIFSLGMIAKFRETLQNEPYRYRHLFWESGMIGQILYLEAEAHGVRGTGIGCYYDDPVHELMGLKDDTYQSLYHFTVGEPMEDRRLTTYPPYSHLGR